MFFPAANLLRVAWRQLNSPCSNLLQHSPRRRPTPALQFSGNRAASPQLFPYMKFLQSCRWILCALFCAASAHSAEPRGKAEHVVLVVWDGMRPDFVSPHYTPTLYQLATEGVFFKNHH